MNMYEMIKKRFLNGEITADDVVRCAREGILTFVEAGQIITLKRNSMEEVT